MVRDEEPPDVSGMRGCRSSGGGRCCGPPLRPEVYRFHIWKYGSLNGGGAHGADGEAADAGAVGLRASLAGTAYPAIPRVLPQKRRCYRCARCGLRLVTEERPAAPTAVWAGQTPPATARRIPTTTPQRLQPFDHGGPDIMGSPKSASGTPLVCPSCSEWPSPHRTPESPRPQP